VKSKSIEIKVWNPWAILFFFLAIAFASFINYILIAMACEVSKLITIFSPLLFTLNYLISKIIDEIIFESYKVYKVKVVK